MEPKQVILVRTDLNLSPGKIAAQAAHASVMALLGRVKGKFVPEQKNKGSFVRYSISNHEWEWFEGSQTKVVLGVANGDELVAIHEMARLKGLPCSLIKDEARTELSEPTFTTAAIGPASPEEINKITGNLNLYRGNPSPPVKAQY